MKMPKANPATVRSSTIAAGSLSSRVLVGVDAKATWAELVHGSILDQGSILDLRVRGSAAEELRGKSVLLATIDQFRAAAALIELDGVARRIVLYPPDVPVEHLAYVAKTAEAEVLITDHDDAASAPHGISSVIRCARNVSPIEAVREDQNAIETEWILLTSGTTGLPKLAVHTLASLAGSAWHTDPASASLVWSTFYDMRRYGGLHIFLHAALTGTSLVVSHAGEPVADFLARAGANGVTNISGTPSHWRRALMSPAASRIAPEYIRMSGEIVDQAILNQVRAQFPQARVAHTFASTEAGVGFNVNDGLMGFPAEILDSNPLIEMKIKDATLRIRSTRTATRYLGEAAPVLKDAEGFVDTGDTIESRNGRYYFTGRRDGTINVGGYKVHPEEVEAVINRHPVVAMSLVKAKKNPITGALVVADVVLNTQAAASSAEEPQREIIEFCRTQLDHHKVPAVINIVTMLPIGDSGKLVRRA
jgi:acyl-coenzyme A synthetase/AMP-(fatty) acid ligase